MSKRFMFKISLILAMTLLMAGCHSDNQQTASITPGTPPSTLTPFTRGPTSPPGVKGPTAPPGQPQAVTENINQKFTLK